MYIAEKWRVMTCAALLVTTRDWARPVPKLFAPQPLTNKLVWRRHLNQIGLGPMNRIENILMQKLLSKYIRSIKSVSN